MTIKSANIDVVAESVKYRKARGYRSISNPISAVKVDCPIQKLTERMVTIVLVTLTLGSRKLKKAPHRDANDIPRYAHANQYRYSE